MIDYKKYEEQLREEIKDQQIKIQELEQERTKLKNEKSEIGKAIKKQDSKLYSLDMDKNNLLKYKYMFLVNIIALIPSILVTLIPLLCVKLFLPNIIFGSSPIIFKLFKAIVYGLLTGLIISPIIDCVFSTVRNKLLNKHRDKVINSKEYQEILINIDILQKQKQENIKLESLKNGQIKSINDSIDLIRNDIRELSGFLNFVCAKNNPKETTLHMKKTLK